MTARMIEDVAALDRLWKAAAHGDSATIRVLAMQGIDLDARDENEQTAYMLARNHNHPSTAQAIQAAREFQYLRKVGIEIARVGNLHSPLGARHYSA